MSYSGTNIVTGEKVAIKVEETLEIDHPILQQEAKIVRFYRAEVSLYIQHNNTLIGQY